MLRIIRFLKPSSLKNRLFVAFLLLIILPFFALQVRNHIQIKSLYEQRISEQSQVQIDQMKEAFEALKTSMLMTALQLEKEPGVIAALHQAEAPEQGAPSVVSPKATNPENPVVRTFLSLKSQFFSAGDQIHYALSDLNGKLYLSYEPAGDLGYEQVMPPDTASRLLSGTEPAYIWADEMLTDANLKDSRGSRMLVLYMPIKGSDSLPAGLLRISFDYRQWLKSYSNHFLIQQGYYVLDQQGEVLYMSDPANSIPRDIGDMVRRQQEDPHRTYIVHAATSSIINSSYIPSVGWYIVAQFPLEIFFGDIRAMNRQYMITFALFTLLFIVITFFILSAITRPLLLLKKKMSEVIVKNFQTSIATDHYKGEMLEIADTFNTMTKDLNRMVNRLKMEERQREAIRFQMLLQQMNPHFLLNTLNTIKWNAMAKGDQASADICISLGKLLETSLNSEADLIHLQEELGLVEAYAAIQNFRYDHRFEVRYEYEEALGYALVPKLSLQPLVENAIQHGFAKLKSGGVITIRILEQPGARLVLEVEDNGTGLQKAAAAAPSSRKRKPIGIKNLTERLQLLFKSDASLELTGLETGTLVRMRIPLLMAKPYGNGGQPNVENIARGG
ncbi:two-component system, sensor histidine kinase YesM [Paenibacillus sp. UNCCL117]|uniref:cache domain-containing sensor histidine kinase n=1 Tax=unclassified Paenibacillus TaxID=185978 RepID=UPI00088D7199|nr:MULTISPECIES: sensor histidine kinase [unclassified Paenibacillus]SDD08023.1 two-component system, sensor histidine kinase YesM [Paenibacillus sp. cl123]SFW31312.1 two-component system, sensor histidine kinase YesM [Paenibacillus sp. UNCCL117]